MNRPSSLRQDRQRQFSYMSQQEHDQMLKQQIEENKIRKQQESLQQFQENIAHYKNNKFGADETRGENPTYMNDLQNLLKNKEREIEKMQMDLNESQGKSRQQVGFGFQGDMNEIARQAQLKGLGAQPNNGGQFATFDRQNYSQRPPNDLFSEDFIKNIRAGPLGNILSNNQEYNNVPTTQRNNENQNIINSIFGNNNGPSINLAHQGMPPLIPPQSASTNSDRDRRIQLRELERKKRLDGIEGGGYGQIGSSNSALGIQQAPPHQVQTAVGGSRRDQIWQQKMMQRVSSQEGPRMIPSGGVQPLLPINNQSQMITIQNQLPINNIQSNEGSGQQLRSSRLGHQLNDAIKLDQSLNYQELMKLKEDAKNSPNLKKINAPVPKPPQAPNVIGNPLLGAEDDIIKRRRENEKKQRQQEYQDFLDKQKGQQVPVPTSQPQKQIQIMSSNEQQQYQQPLQHQPSLPTSTKSKHQNTSSLDTSANSSVLQAAGGLNLLGLHQLKRDEDKATRQRQYREQLDSQAASRKIEPILTGARKKDLSDQVFAEILQQPRADVSPNGGFVQYQQYYSEKQQQPVIQQEKQFFLKAPSEEERKKIEMDKKREYGIQLQQQMAQQQQKSASSESDQRRRRGGSTQPHQVPQQDPSQFQQQNQFPQNRIFDYQQQPSQNYMPPPQQQFQQPLPFNGFQQPQYQAPPMMYQQPIQPQFQQPPQFNYQMQYPPQMMQQQQQQPPVVQQPSHSPNNILSGDPEAQQQQAMRQKKEEYRRELEKQMKQNDEQKKHQKAIQDKEKSEELQQILGTVNKPPQQSTSQPPMSAPQPPQYGFQQPVSQGVISSDPSFGGQQQAQGNNFVRQRTDLTNNTTTQEDAERKSRQQQYQEELQKQVEDRKRQKDEEKRKIKEEEELMERKMQQQQQELVKREERELQKEGRGPQKEEKKRNVRRDLFEPSSENVGAQYGQAKAKPSQRQEEPQKWEQPSTFETKNIQPSQFSNQQSNNYNSQPPHFNNQLPAYQNQQPSQFQESRPSVDLPIYNKRRDDLFGNAQSSYNEGRFSFEPSQSNPYQGSQPSYLMPESSQYSSNYQNQPPLTTSGLRTNQPPPLNDEYQKMISMYQHAFQEIIEFKNQYMEEVMRMRERVIKEREEILEYEKVKQQQHLEIQNLRAVYERLGDMLQPEEAQINPRVQQNLDDFLIKQQQDIMRMSQAQGNVIAQMNQQYNQNQIQIPQPLAQQQYQMPQQRMQVNPYANQHLQESPNVLEQSLSSDTKFVVVPGKNGPQVQAVNNGASTQMMQTWDENQILDRNQPRQQQQPTTLAQLQALTTTIGQSLQGSSQFMTGHDQSGALKTSSKMIPRPTMLGQTSNTIPETIHELPSNQEEDNIHSRLQSAAGLVAPSERANSKQQQVRPTIAEMRQQVIKEEDNDFNSRESSKSRGEQQQHIVVQEQVRVNSNIKYQDESNYNIGRDPNESSYIEDQRQPIFKPPVPTSHTPVGSHPPNTSTLDKNLDQIDHLLHKHTPQQQPSQKPHLPLAANVSIERHEVDTTIRQKSELRSITSPMNSVQKTHQKTGERFHHAGVTGSSFYNATIQMQKEKEQTEQEEFQQQLLRIYGAPANNNNVEQPPVEALTHKSNKKVTPVQENHNSTTNQQSFKPHGTQMIKSHEERELMMQTNINIADSINEDTQKQIINNMAIIAQLNAQRQAQINQSRFSSSNLEAQQPYSRKQSGVAPRPQTKQSAISDQYDDDEEVYNDEIEEQVQPEEVQMQKPKINQVTGSYVARDLQSTNLAAGYQQQFQDTADSKMDIWNDPDLVPPPVVLLSDRQYMEEEGDGYFQDPPIDNQMTYEDDHNYQHFNAPENHRNAYMLPGSSNGNTNSLNGGTIKQLQLLSPPSQGDEEEKINIGTYNQYHINHDIQTKQEDLQHEHQKKGKSPLKRPPMSAKPQSQTKSPSLHNQHETSSQKHHKNFNLQPQPVHHPLDNRINHLAVPMPGSQFDNYQDGGSISDRSISKKEKDILDVMKQIQMAKEKTNSLLGNTDQFKFKFKKEGGVASELDQRQHQLVSAKEPLKLKAAQINRNAGNTTLASAGQQSSHRQQRSEALHHNNDADSQIMQNIDRLLMNLEDQKGKTGILNQSGLFDLPNHQREEEGYQIGVEDEEEQSRYGQPSVDPITAMQNESGINLRSKNQMMRPISGNNHQNSVNTQSRLNKGSERIMEEVERTYGQRRDISNAVNSSNQQVYLRPVSGKSNSNRYGGSRGESRSKSRTKGEEQAYNKSQQHMYFDEDEEDQPELQ